MVTALRHAGIVVTDLARSLSFYRDLLGLRVVVTMDEHGKYIDSLLGLSDTRVTTVKLAAGEGATLLELLQFQVPHAAGPVQRGIYETGPSHVAFTVEKLDAVVEKLLAAGEKFISPPQLSLDGAAKVVFCKDPDGTPLELVEMLGNDKP